MNRKSLEERSIKDNFVFGAVMQNPKKCKALLECILGIKIRKIKYPELEKTIDKAIGAKSVRLDVYVEDEFDTIYNIEIQATNRKNLPKRSRYYQGIIDINIIDKGDDYKKLKKSYVIFICDYDEFGKGRHIYTFENMCLEESGLRLGDDTVKIILNTKGTMDDVGEDVKELLHYIAGQEPKSELTRSLDAEVSKVKSSKKWRRKFMTLLMRDNENKTLGQYMKLVGLIRKIEVDECKTASKYLDVDEEFIRDVIEFLEEHPTMDDEEVAEIVMDW